MPSPGLCKACATRSAPRTRLRSVVDLTAATVRRRSTAWMALICHRQQGRRGPLICTAMLMLTIAPLRRESPRSRRQIEMYILTAPHKFHFLEDLMGPTPSDFASLSVTTGFLKASTNWMLETVQAMTWPMFETSGFGTWVGKRKAGKPKFWLNVHIIFSM